MRDGSLIIPSIADWGPGKNPPVPMTEELTELLTTLQAEFNHITSPGLAIGSEGTPTGPTPGSPSPGNPGLPGNVDPVPLPDGGGTAPQMASGTLLANRAELLQAPGCSCKLLK